MICAKRKMEWDIHMTKGGGEGSQPRLYSVVDYCLANIYPFFLPTFMEGVDFFTPLILNLIV